MSVMVFSQSLGKLLFAVALSTHLYPALAQDKAIPVEDFFKASVIRNVELSPDGQTLGMLVADENERLMLAVMDIATRKLNIIVRKPSTDVAYFYWINSQRLGFGLLDLKEGANTSTNNFGIFAVNKDGSNQRQLAEQFYGRDALKFRMMAANTSFASVSGVKDSNDIFVTQRAGTRQNRINTLFRLDTVTGLSTPIQAPSNSVGFLTDKKGELRAAVSSVDDKIGIHYKDPKNNVWRLLKEFNPYTESGFTPRFISPEGDLYVSAHQGNDNSSIYKYDLTKNEIEKTPLVSAKGFDLGSANFIYNLEENKLLGISYETDARGVMWLDPEYKNLQKKIDDALPNTVNIISFPSEASTNVVLVQSYSDVHPISYFLYDTKTAKFTPIGEAKPEIDSKKMSFKDFVRIKARDGLEIPTYVTLPKNSTGKNLPMVVMVHGGPNVRGVHWGWNPQTQFLASRGYVVIEPEFRGSEGYGQKLFNAGKKQWGLKMQDDLDDVREWAVKQGYADTNRVCIAGASYGGYAVLMGLIRNPELYKCGISWVGVSDINLLYNASWGDTAGSNYAKYGMPIMVGDQEKDAAQLKATSPLEQAARLKSPLILAYGAADVRVPLVHGRRFYDAVKDHNKDVDYIVYTEEAHGWRLLKNNVDFWTRSEKFLETHIGK